MKKQILGGLLIGALFCGLPIYAEINNNTVLAKGINVYTLSVDVGKLEKGFLFLKFPEKVKPINWSFKINGKKVKLKPYKDYYVIKLTKVNGKIQLTGRVFVRDKIKSSEIKYAVVKVLPRISIISDKQSGNFIKKILLTYPIPNKDRILTKTIENKVKILYPEGKDLITSKEYTDIVVVVPSRIKYELLLNGKAISLNKISEILEDKKRGLAIVRFTAVKLEPGKNEIVLKVDNKIIDKKTIYLASNYKNIEIAIYPKPVADGKTPLILVFRTKDKNGYPVNVNTYITVSTEDKLYYWDTEEKTYKPLVNTRIKLVAGKGFLRLKPINNSGTYTIILKYKGKEFKKSFTLYPPKEKWVIGGFLDGALIFGNKGGPNEKIFDTGLDFSKGYNPYLTGSGAIFAKGSYKDYLITLRYDSRNPFENPLMQDNPSSEGGPFYPVYGDKSQQYFEARSSEKLYAKIQKDLSYLLYGDYNTNFGENLLFNTYRRVLTGEYLNLEEKENYRVRAFLSRLKRDIVRETFKGNGLSGPYYLKNPVEPFTEEVWIEIRDRYNPNVILNRKKLERYVDYDINYDLNYIIFHEPIPEYDENFNPIYVVVNYETPELVAKKYIYGARIEKVLKNLKFGLSAIQEERSLGKYRLYGVDLSGIKTKYGRFTFEAARSDGIDKNGEYTEGNAYRFDWFLNKPSDKVHFLYKQSESGFYNPYSSLGGWFQTLMLDYKHSIGGGFWRLGAEKELRSGGYERKTLTGELQKSLNTEISSTLGLRWNDETFGESRTEYLQGIAGFTYRPNDKFSFSLRREQAFKNTKSETYPTRTIGKINYRINNSLASFIQTEYRDTAEDKLLLTGGLQGSYTKGTTTVYGKQLVNYEDLDWRTKSQIGLKHVFQITDKWSIDVGGEGQYSFVGSKSSDFLTLRFRNLFKDVERERYWSSSLEGRFRHGTPQYLLNFKGKEKINDRWFVLFNERFIKGDSANNLFFLAFAYRPLFGSNWTSISKFIWKYDSKEANKHSYIGSVHFDYKKGNSWQFMGSVAAKYTTYSDLEDSFSYTVRGRILKNFQNFYLDLHAGYLYQVNTKTYIYTFGPEIGFIPLKNVRLGLGYNINGFVDKDFEDADYWHGGFYLRFTAKFDTFDF